MSPKRSSVYLMTGPKWGVKTFHRRMLYFLWNLRIVHMDVLRISNSPKNFLQLSFYSFCKDKYLSQVFVTSFTEFTIQTLL
jgi:hypothetical protein